ncbi:DNA repair protein RecO [Mesorhizobium sp. M4B.F.Ca.ET.215.01.1.1]|uniref:DNA repair protein RecO n=1 Tax=unclassified Mesorhizobium TaxID=325217 RepID=UPI000FCB2B13|nr:MULTISPECIES: DNA repair protein RecO [unclassified Mesorhizobium]RVD40892.1 DNA repair protein RecO [Mesorhizobium sp. M4B.F.Ca.ET.019.03.1.1]RWC87055.1 MAG: DNA repair protein RecO [Mesorhizobium sp.]RWF66228.1 MAG: DNA repair protein RecO [Mesorhizobium sp.]RWX69486.1 DNA repair protein RecO [Mesorhizobium sp. M4B.F.Ca.ET.089.01.1.1]TGQ13359.1 DNA repair protein RecO [Mesorhizobium sp. M4B.F.Ca.ET.215.01.1.1]
MEWRDEGIILGTRKHGETSAILEVMTRAHGRHLGLVRGGRSRKQQPVLQPGNRVDLLWRARLDEHLGTFQAEAIEMNAARLIDSAVAVYGLQTMAAHLRLLPERDAHGALYETLAVMIAHLDDADAAGELVARFELLILDELGFGLDLSQCAATGSRQDLAYVSPKSGRAVSRAAGAPWHDKMLALPAFLQRSGPSADQAALEDAFRLTGFFFSRHVYEPRGLEPPDARAGFLAALRRHHAAGKAIAGE